MLTFTKAKDEISKKEDQIVFTEKLISGELQSALSEPEFKTMPQAEFDKKLRQIGA